MVIAEGEIWWADLGEPVGSSRNTRCPVVVVRSDPFNRSALQTVVRVPLTSSLRWAVAPGNVLLSTRSTGLPRESVANISQIVTLDEQFLAEQAGRLPRAKLDLVLPGIDIVLGRP